MAIKNTLLGGTDWVGKEHFKSEDLNDTFNALTGKIQTLSAFWLNDELYDVYDDFESYDVGSFTTNDKWDVTISASPSCVAETTIELSTQAGGTSKELRLNSATTGTANTNAQVTVSTNNLEQGKHFYCKCRFVQNKGGTTETYQNLHTAIITFSGTNYALVNEAILGYRGDVPGDLLSHIFEVKVISKGVNNYDFYVNQILVGSNINTTTPSVSFFGKVRSPFGVTRGSSVFCYIDDVRVSKFSVQ